MNLKEYYPIALEFFSKTTLRIFASLPGAAGKLAPRLLVEWDDDRERYENAAVVQALAGTSPVLFQSGKYRFARQRKSCIKPLRRAMHLFAFQSIRQVSWAREYYDTKRSQGKTHYEALRPLANIWVWITIAALSEYIKLEPVGGNSARVSVSYKGVTVEVFSHSTSREPVDFATQRYQSKDGGYSLDSWSGVVLAAYREFGGIRIPAKVEVMWNLETGNLSYFRGEVAEIEYDVPAVY